VKNYSGRKTANNLSINQPLTLGLYQGHKNGFNYLIYAKIFVLPSCNLFNTILIIMLSYHCHVTGNASPEVSSNETYSPYSKTGSTLAKENSEEGTLY
jgi:hypothetical protein